MTAPASATLIHLGHVGPAAHAGTAPPANTRCGLLGHVTGTDARRLADHRAASVQLHGAQAGSPEWRRRAGWAGPDRITADPDTANCPACRPERTSPPLPRPLPTIAPRATVPTGARGGSDAAARR